MAQADLPRGLRESLVADRIHSAYLLSGPGARPGVTALAFVRALVCEGDRRAAPCESCRPCRLSAPGEPLPLDGTGRKGPLLRHVGDHPDLLWVERGADDTRVRIAQVRALQAALRLRGSSGGARAAVIADAEWLNQEAQNALLRLLEEPPPRTSLVLVTQSPAGLLATVRSRCQRIGFPPEREALRDEETLALRARLDTLPKLDIPALLDWAEEYRGPRAVAAAGTTRLLGGAATWLHERLCAEAQAGRRDLDGPLRAFATLQQCRKALAQRNANPQMVAERALLALRDAELG